MSEGKKVQLSDGREVTVGRLPFGGIVAIRDTIKNRDVLGAIENLWNKAAEIGEESMEAIVGVEILMSAPDFLLAFMKWTVTENGSTVPSSDEFIQSIPAVDVPKIATECVADIGEILTASKNLIGPVREKLAGQAIGTSG